MSASQEKSALEISIDLPPAEYLRLEKAAEAKKMTVPEFLLYVAQVFTHLETTSAASR